MDEFSTETFKKKIDEYFGEESKDFCEDSDDWKFDKEDKSIKMKLWTKVGSNPLLVKHVMEIPLNATQMLKYFESMELTLGANKRVSSFKILENKKNEILFVVETKIPVPFMSDRFTLTRRRILNKSEKLFYLMAQSINDSDHKLLPKSFKKGKVQMVSFNIRKIIENEDGKSSTMYTYEIKDLKGSMPAFITNLANKKIPFGVCATYMKNWKLIEAKMKKEKKEKEEDN